MAPQRKPRGQRQNRKPVADKAASNFPKMGDEMTHDVVNASGQSSPNTIAAPRDAGGPRDSRVPGAGTKQNKKSTMIDATTGQELADEVDASVRSAAQRTAARPSMTIPALIDPHERRAQHRAARETAVREQISGMDEAGPLGPGIYLNSPAHVFEWVFGLRD